MREKNRHTGGFFCFYNLYDAFMEKMKAKQIGNYIITQIVEGNAGVVAGRTRGQTDA